MRSTANAAASGRCPDTRCRNAAPPHRRVASMSDGNAAARDAACATALRTIHRRDGGSSRGSASMGPWLGGESGRVLQDVDQQLPCGEPVGQAVVDLRHVGQSPIGEPVDPPDLPERAISFEPDAGDQRDHLVELSSAAGRRDGGPAHVVVGIDDGIIDPPGMTEPERDLHHASAERLVVRHDPGDAVSKRLPRLIAGAHGRGRRSPP